MVIDRTKLFTELRKKVVQERTIKRRLKSFDRFKTEPKEETSREK